MGDFRGVGSSHEWGREGTSLCVISNTGEFPSRSAQGFVDSPATLSAERVPAPSPPPSLLVSSPVMSRVGLVCASRFGDQTHPDPHLTGRFLKSVITCVEV